MLISRQEKNPSSASTCTRERVRRHNLERSPPKKWRLPTGEKTIHIWWFPETGVPVIIHFSRWDVPFKNKNQLWWYPHFKKPPYNLWTFPETVVDCQRVNKCELPATSKWGIRTSPVVAILLLEHDDKRLIKYIKYIKYMSILNILRYIKYIKYIKYLK